MFEFYNMLGVDVSDLLSKLKNKFSPTTIIVPEKLPQPKGKNELKRMGQPKGTQIRNWIIFQQKH
jgi:hypothetical protein